MSPLFLLSFAALCSAYKYNYNPLTCSRPDPYESWSDTTHDGRTPTHPSLTIFALRVICQSRPAGGSPHTEPSPISRHMRAPSSSKMSMCQWAVPCISSFLPRRRTAFKYAPPGDLLPHVRAAIFPENRRRELLHLGKQSLVGLMDPLWGGWRGSRFRPLPGR